MKKKITNRIEYNPNKFADSDEIAEGGGEMNTSSWLSRGNMTTVLDPCCGGRMFYFEKDHPNIFYADCRHETVEMKDKGKIRTLEIDPDLVMDFTDMTFPDKCFSFVVFDPPHLMSCGKNSWLAKKYGKLDKDTWRDTLNKGLSECLRVVKPGCVVAMKWSEGEIKTADMLKVLPQQPAFGDKTGKTRWLFFVKTKEDNEILQASKHLKRFS